MSSPQSYRRIYNDQKREADAVLAHVAEVEAARIAARVEDRHRTMMDATVPVDPADLSPGDVIAVDKGARGWRVERVVRINAQSITLEGGSRVGRAGTFRRFKIQ